MRILVADIIRTYELLKGSHLKRIVSCLLAPGVQAVIVFRFGQWAYSQPTFFRAFLIPIYLIMNGMVKVMWGIEIGRSAKIGAGFYIGHFGGITISDQAIIGKHCNISQNVTIGISGQKENRGVPVIGDNVYIAPGARLFGKIYIGNNVKIGANAVIYKDIEADAIVVLDPGFKIISNQRI